MMIILQDLIVPVEQLKANSSSTDEALIYAANWGYQQAIKDIKDKEHFKEDKPK